jgi:hypothetical protein
MADSTMIYQPALDVTQPLMDTTIETDLKTAFDNLTPAEKIQIMNLILTATEEGADISMRISALREINQLLNEQFVITFDQLDTLKSFIISHHENQ